ncbi:MAG: GAF domain-containing protein [Oscillospiraceae bacterium]|nr:GAF domain-containing protein [Oscillospiraceae bacterium]
MLKRADLHEIVAISSELTTEKDKNLLLEKLLSEAMKISACDAGTLYVFEKGKLAFHTMKTISQKVNRTRKKIDLPPVELREENVCAYAAIHREMINVPDVYDSDSFDFSGPMRYDEMTGYHTRSMLVVPLEDSEQKLIGVLQLINKLDGKGEVIPFTEDDEFSLQSLGSMTAVSLSNMIYSELVKDSSKTFSAFIFVFCIWMVIYALWQYLGQPVSTDVMTHGVELMGFLMFFYVLAKTSLSWKDLGIKTEHPWKVARIGLLIAVCAIAAMCGIKAIIRSFAPNAFGPEYPFFDIRAFGVRQIIYIATAGVQEFLARSVIQGNLRRIMVGRHVGTAAIVISSLSFATLHIHLGLVFMLGAALLAGLEGILYEKQQSIYGVWIVHWALGVTATLLHFIDH